MRVLLSEWEWACCGDPFATGDEITLTVATPDSWVSETYGELAGGVDRMETHHETQAEGTPLESVRGRVGAIHAVYLGHSVTRTPRDPGAQAELEEQFAAAARAADGEAFGWFGTSSDPLTPFTVTLEPIPGTGRTVPVDRVPVFSPDAVAEARASAALTADIPPATVEQFSGYLVDLDLR